MLIRAHGDYYPIDRIPAFWTWLLAMAERGRVKMPAEIYDEVAGSSDHLGKWMKSGDVKRALVLDEPANVLLVRKVLDCYAPDLSDVEIKTIGRDPFLVAATLNGPGRVAVTRERSAKAKTRANRRIPDICIDLAVTSIDDFELWRRLDFRLA